jgi:hypothetical protein
MPGPPELQEPSPVGTIWLGCALQDSHRRKFWEGRGMPHPAIRRGVIFSLYGETYA